jgi:hypothetical protein
VLSRVAPLLACMERSDPKRRCCSCGQMLLFLLESCVRGTGSAAREAGIRTAEQLLHQRVAEEVGLGRSIAK